MKKNNKNGSNGRSNPSNPNPQAALALLQQTEPELGSPSADLSQVARDVLGAALRRSPAMTIGKFIELAERHDGVLLGIEFDPEQARRDMDDASAMRSCEAVARRLAGRARDQAYAKAGVWAQKAGALASAMKQMSRTPEGKALQLEYDELQASRPRGARGRKRAPAEAPPQAATRAAPPGTVVELPVEAGATISTTVSRNGYSH